MEAQRLHVPTPTTHQVGCRAIVFEPSPSNVLHLLSSVRRNGFRDVQLNTLCVSDTVSLCAIGKHGRNQGALQHTIGSSDAEAARGASSPLQRASARTMAVPIDTVLPPQDRPTFVKLDIEGGECAAMRGMHRLLNSSTNIVGALVEFDKSFSCCRELINPESGGFWLLASRHSLCAYQAPVAKPVHTKPTSLADLCQIRANGRQLNLRWDRCPDLGNGV